MKHVSLGVSYSFVKKSNRDTNIKTKTITKILKKKMTKTETN